MVRNQLDAKFHGVSTLIRRNPVKYMHNPVRVFHTAVDCKNFAVYEMPGNNNSIISKNRMP